MATVGVKGLIMVNGVPMCVCTDNLSPNIDCIVRESCRLPCLNTGHCAAAAILHDPDLWSLSTSDLCIVSCGGYSRRNTHHLAHDWFHSSLQQSAAFAVFQPLRLFTFEAYSLDRPVIGGHRRPSSAEVVGRLSTRAVHWFCCLVCEFIEQF